MSALNIREYKNSQATLRFELAPHVFYHLKGKPTHLGYDLLHKSQYLFTYLFVYLSIYLFANLSIYLFFFIYLFVYLFLYLLIYLCDRYFMLYPNVLVVLKLEYYIPFGNIKLWERC